MHGARSRSSPQRFIAPRSADVAPTFSHLLRVGVSASLALCRLSVWQFLRTASFHVLLDVAPTMSNHQHACTPRRDTLARPRLSENAHPFSKIHEVRLKIHRAGRGDVLARLLEASSRETPSHETSTRSSCDHSTTRDGARTQESIVIKTIKNATQNFDGTSLFVWIIFDSLFERYNDLEGYKMTE